MPSGVARSKFIRPMADALGWRLGRLRELFQRADYHSPYTDLPRALRILKTLLPEKLPAVLKALNLDETALQASDSPGGQQLVLMPPASPAAPTPEGTTVALTPHIAPRSLGGRGGLVDRLVHAIPGDEDVASKRDKVRAILKKHGADGRMKDEVRALAWIKKVFPEAAFKADETVTAVEIVSDLETLPAPRLRELIKSLMAELADKQRQLKQFQTKLGAVNYLLDATKNKMVGESGLYDVTEEQALFFLANAEAKRPL